MSIEDLVEIISNTAPLEIYNGSGFPGSSFMGINPHKPETLVSNVKPITITHNNSQQGPSDVALRQFSPTVS